MKVSRATLCEMEEGSSTIKMAGTTRVSGATTKWTDMANCTTREENWLMKATGRKMSSTDMAKYTTTTLWSSKYPSITQTLTFYKTTGSTTKACSCMTASREEDAYVFLTASILKETSIMIVFKASGSSTLKTDK